MQTLLEMALALMASMLRPTYPTVESTAPDSYCPLTAVAKTCVEAMTVAE